MPADRLEDQLEALANMSFAELKDEWRGTVRTPLPRVSQSVLRLALAWQIQAKMFGGVDLTARQSLEQIRRGKTRTTALAPGMRLVREWDGKVHVVTVDERGDINWNGQRWNSLSRVANAITGSHWSGPAFFGLKKRA